MIFNTHKLLFLKFCLLLFLISLLKVSPSFAGVKTSIKPIIDIGYQRDSNFFKSKTNTKTVDTYTIKPIIQMDFDTDKSQLSLEYSFNVIKYDDKDKKQTGQANAENLDYTEHHANVTVQTRLTDRILVGIDDVFWKTRNSAYSDSNTNSIDRFEYSRNEFTPRISYGFTEKFTLTLKYTNLDTDYIEDGPGQGEDSTENRGTFILNYSPNDSTSFDLNYQVWSRDYSKNSVEYTSQQTIFNLYQPLNYFTLSAGVGYHTRDFDTTTEDISRFIWKASIYGQNTSNTTGIPKSSVHLSVGSNLNNSGSGNSYFDSTRFDANFTYLLTEKINTRLIGYFQNSDYQTSSRDDDTYRVSLAADYFFNDLLSFGLEGGMENRDSNEATHDYDNKYFMFNVRFNVNTWSRE